MGVTQQPEMQGEVVEKAELQGEVVAFPELQGEVVVERAEAQGEVMEKVDAQAEVVVEKQEMEGEVVEAIAVRLSMMPELYLPFSLSSRGDSVTNLEKRCHLSDLLRRDAAIFLERYGSSLLSSELQEFDVFKEDYEVSWHLKQLKFVKSPTEKQRRAQAVAVKNRRLAFMDQLMQDGQYFSEDSMRMREPLLHHEYLGRFQDPNDRAFHRPGERWSETLIRQAEEAEIEARLKVEMEKAGLVEEHHNRGENDVEEEEESIDEKDEDEEGNEEMLYNRSRQQLERENKEITSLEQTATSEVILKTSEDIDKEELVELLNEEPQRFTISDEEMQFKLEDFTRIMQEKFLSGEDTEHMDYSKIDHDTALDDYWLDEISQDAEEKYFDEDED